MAGEWDEVRRIPLRSRIEGSSHCRVRVVGRVVNCVCVRPVGVAAPPRPGEQGPGCRGTMKLAIRAIQVRYSHPTFIILRHAASPPDDRVVSVERRIEISSCSQHHVRAATLIGRDDERC